MLSLRFFLRLILGLLEAIYLFSLAMESTRRLKILHQGIPKRSYIEGVLWFLVTKKAI